MIESLLVAIAALALVTLAGLVYLVIQMRRLASPGEAVSHESIAQLLRAETELARRAGDDQARGARQEMAEHVKGAQDSTLKTFGLLGDQIAGLRDRLEAGVRAIADKLDGDIRRMGEEASSSRETLRGLIEGKLDATASKQAEDGKGLREELNVGFDRASGNMTNTLTAFGHLQKERLEANEKALGELTARHDNALLLLRQENAAKLDATVAAVAGLNDHVGAQMESFRERLDAGVKAIGETFDSNVRRMGEEAGVGRETLRHLIEGKLDAAAAKQSEDGKGLREELNAAFHRLGGNLATDLGNLADRHDKTQESLRQSVETRLDAIRGESASKLEEMRRTVDEKLQTTLESRLGESFSRVVEYLKSVHDGLGEMKALASNVGDLKNVLTNVKVRGTFGETQLELLLEQFLAPEQFVRQAQVKENSSERVEFAVRYPRDGGEILLPIDAKFPRASYDRLIDATENSDIQAARNELAAAIRLCAKDIRDKYIAPPKTTDFAFLFLPTEGLFAEVLRQPGLFDQIQRDFKVTLSGPTTLCAMLQSLQMGIRSVAIEKRSGEVWTLLSAVQSEFSRYDDVVKRLAKQLDHAKESVDKLGTRTRAMSRTLRAVEKLPDGLDGKALLGLSGYEASATGDEALLEAEPPQALLVAPAA